MSRPQASAYSIRDMAEDTLGLMDALGCESAHAVGCSMGGMVGDRDRAPGAPANADPRLSEPHVDSYLRLVAESWRAMRARLEREDFAHDGSSPAARAGGRARAAPDARGRLVAGRILPRRGVKGELKCERFTGGFHVVTRKNGQAVSYRWVYVQSQDRIAIKSTSTAAGAAPVAFADVVCARPSPR